MFHKVPKADFTVATTGLVSIGVYLKTNYITPLDDTNLKGQIAGSRAFGEGGAHRLEIKATWGYDGDSQEGDYYHVTDVKDGVLNPQTPPPQIDPVNSALARYDREANGNYIVNGYKVIALGLESNQQVFSIGEGTANVWGEKIIRDTGQRIKITETPDLKQIEAEPHAIPTDASGAVVIALNHTPVMNIDHVTLTKRVTDTLTHGAFSGASDPLPNTSVADIVEVTQGATTYVEGTDYQIVNDEVDWSLGGAEPAPGSSYQVEYKYLDTTNPDAWDSTTITVSDVDPGSTAIVAYDYALPRIDTIAVDRGGQVRYIPGRSSDYDPYPPQVPHDALRLADIINNWGNLPTVRAVATHSVHFNEIENHGVLIDDLKELISHERLRRDMDSRQRTTKRGMFVDPFLDDDMRDAGIAQTGAILDESLQLPIDAAAESDVLGDDPLLLPYVEEVLVNQPLSTGEMKINPYQAFEPLPANLTLSPAVDRFTQIDTQWTSAVTRQIVRWRWWWQRNIVGGTTETIERVNTTFSDAQFLRPIEISFTLEGFGPGENLETMTIDGVEVTPTANQEKLNVNS